MKAFVELLLVTELDRTERLAPILTYLIREDHYYFIIPAEEIDTVDYEVKIAGRLVTTQEITFIDEIDEIDMAWSVRLNMERDGWNFKKYPAAALIKVWLLPQKRATKN